MNKKYLVKLTPDERASLHQLISTGKAAARKLQHARVLLKADQGEQGPGWSDEQISEACEVSTSTIQRIRQRLKAPARAHPVRPQTYLHIGRDLSFHQYKH